MRKHQPFHIRGADRWRPEPSVACCRGLPVARVWPIGGRDSIGRPLRSSAEGPRRERQGLVWLLERKGRDRGGLKEWAGIEDVAQAATESCNRPDSFPESSAGS